VSTEILRGVLSPVGHGLWTAIMGGVLFRERRNNRFVVDRPVVLTYLGVSALHALWDSSHGIAVWIVAKLTDSGKQQLIFQLGYFPDPTREQVRMFTVFSTTGLVLVAALGLLWLRVLISNARRAGHRTDPHRP
jgi:hypothetical protein